MVTVQQHSRMELSAASRRQLRMRSIRVASGLGALALGVAGCAASPKSQAAMPPRASTAAFPSAGGAVVHVLIHADGAMFVDGKPEPNLDAVAKEVERGRTGALGSVKVVLTADESAAAARVIGVVDRLKKDGVKEFALAVSSPPAPSPVASSAAPVSSSASAADAGPPSPSLPEVSVHNIGLHIGGGPNDDASKAPFRQAIAPHFDEFLKCYRQVEEPSKGGTFGVDLLVGRRGGNPEVRQPRTAMKGQAFRRCMIHAFSQIEFQRPKKPTVFSYSVRFEVGSR